MGGEQKIVQGGAWGGGTPVKLQYVKCTVVGDGCKRFNELFSAVLCCH
jgi:hypothetical protein